MEKFGLDDTNVVGMGSLYCSGTLIKREKGGRPPQAVWGRCWL